MRVDTLYALLKELINLGLSDTEIRVTIEGDTDSVEILPFYRVNNCYVAFEGV